METIGALGSDDGEGGNHRLFPNCCLSSGFWDVTSRKAGAD